MALPRSRSLRDLLFGGSADVLVRLLTVPVRPQSLPFPLVLSRNGRRATQTISASGDSLQETRGDKQFKRKADSEGPPGSPRYHKRAKTHGGNDALAFSDLPPEIHLLIFDHIEFIEDIICLGLASRYFWTFARDYVHTYYMSFLGRWAGENIVCVGKGVKPGDYPRGLFSAEELDTFQQRKANLWVPNDGHLQYVLCGEPFSLRHFTSPRVSVVEEAPDLGAESWRLYSHCRGRAKQEDSAFRATYSELVVTMSTYTPRDQPWILRNLTTKQFVRSEAIALKPEYIRGPDISVLGFGEVVLSRICWSTSSSVGLNERTNISRGVWAGHCFDITTLARHQDDTGGEEWTDVSDEVAKEIANIWQAEYGADLRGELCYWYQRRPNRPFFDITP
ncbi:hypothetical protein MMYC01_209937 [Madurella mycetomatis]|uniref:F-box domain-containing protein n=1 Tax=Madurella mycetomatis TaxID=100816 RepID=A0A175VSV4_9PEZI|nr:hypothetical protein MMYC01_209937 [Madurella mycetomatis]